MILSQSDTLEVSSHLMSMSLSPIHTSPKVISFRRTNLKYII